MPLTVRAPARRTELGCRALDLVVASLTLLVLLPVLLLVMLAIRLESPGPAIFRQRRVGRDLRPFTCLKLRTMRADADDALHRAYVTSLIQGGGERQDGRLFKLAADPRITRVGRWLRRLSLDELPQLVNVLLGHMSVVGPRPAMPYEVEACPAWYLERHSVRPGLTGLWQVSGRNRMSFEEMVRLDIDYARRRSTRLNVRILARTPLAVLRSDAA
jgi:lipopolysaccharide/colanic/teichoic acid biosynthesis glycosyltransferase